MQTEAPHEASHRLPEGDLMILRSCWSLFFLIVAFAVFYVPMNMDEAGIFHVLACIDHPFASFNIFREACYQKNDLTMLGGLTLTRPAFYAGLFHSILYAPFYFLFHAQEAQYLFGLCFFLPFAVLMSRLTSRPRLSLGLFVAFFPVLFQFIHDAGPVKFEMLVFPLTALLLRRSCFSQTPARFVYGLLCAALIVCATEDKAFFLYLLPGLVLFCLAFLVESNAWYLFLQRVMRAMPALTLTALLSAIGILLLMFATNQWGQTYISWLMSLAKTQQSFWAWGHMLVLYGFYWPAYAHNTFIIEAVTTPMFLFAMVTGLFVCTLIVSFFRTKGMMLRPRALLLLASFFATLVVFALMRNTWAGHHFVFLWIPLLILFADGMAAQKEGYRLFLVVAFLGLNLASVLALTQLPIPTKAAREKEIVFDYFNNKDRAETAIINFASWGGYYIQALYGPKAQLVTYTEPYEDKRPAPLYPAYAGKLLDIAATTDRTIYTVCYDPICTKENLEKTFGNRVRMEEVMKGMKEWHIFKAVPPLSNTAR